VSRKVLTEGQVLIFCFTVIKSTHFFNGDNGKRANDKRTIRVPRKKTTIPLLPSLLKHTSIAVGSLVRFFWWLVSLPSYRTSFLFLATLLGAFFLFSPPWVLSQKTDRGINDKQNYPIERSMIFALLASPLDAEEPATPVAPHAAPSDSSSLINLEESTFLPMNVPFPGEEPKGITTYKVRPGDTLASVAGQFGLQKSTIMWANNLGASNSLRPGIDLVILPVDGVLHTVKKGESVGQLSLLYEVYTEEIIAANGLSDDGFIIEGQKIIIPGGKPLPAKPRPVPGSHFTEFSGGFIMPAPGAHRSQGLHFNNAADLANSCGSPLVAAAGGVVIRVKTSGWNGGFGDYVMIQHRAGIVTVYGHMQRVSVEEGQQVGQGSPIGQLGATGRATGCHVHFEVRGARNPFIY